MYHRVHHIHMLLRISSKLSMLAFIGYLKVESSLMIFDRHVNLKYKYGNHKLLCKGFHVNTLGRKESDIRIYPQPISGKIS